MTATFRPVVACTVLALSGFLAWAVFAVVPALSGRGFAEAWDTRAYWTAGLPVLLVLHAAAGFWSASALPRLPLCALAGHGVAMLALHRAGTDAALVPIMMVVVALPLYAALLAAAWLGRQLAELAAPA